MMRFPNQISTVCIAMLLLAGQSAGSAPHSPQLVTSYEGLEDPYSTAALAWSQTMTKRSQDLIRSMPERESVARDLELALKDAPQTPEFYPRDRMLVRFQRSATKPHGVISIALRNDRGEFGDWRDVLDLGHLRHIEKKPYEFRYYNFDDACLPPTYVRCVLPLSIGGSLDVELREFNLVTGKFVVDGFNVPRGRNMATWLDADHLLIQHTVGQSAKMGSGWPAEVRIWTRGQPLSRAKVVFRSDRSDNYIQITSAGPIRDRVGIIQSYSGYSSPRTFIVRADGQTEPTDIPSRRKMGLVSTAGRFVYFQTTEAVKVAGATLPQDALVAYDLGNVAPNRTRYSVIAMSSDELGYIIGFGGSRRVYIVRDRRGIKRLDQAYFQGGKWRVTPGLDLPIGVTPRIGRADPTNNSVLLQRTGFLLPTRTELLTPSGKQTLLYAEKPAFDARLFRVELNRATSNDGTEIDYFAVRPEKIPDGGLPTLITGYGAFGTVSTPGYFDIETGGRSLVPWFKRGGALVLPLIRGGGERGHAWHIAALRENRQTSYDDFLTVAQSLVSRGLTTPTRLGVFGLSNGGLLTAVAATQRPDLFGAAVSDVPLTDMIRFPVMGMGQAWIDEFGDPDDPKIARALMRYSPFAAIHQNRRYPPWLLTTATNDDGVGPGHARKMAARLLDVGDDVYFIEETDGGHSLSDPLSKPDLMADRMTFLINKLMRR